MSFLNQAIKRTSIFFTIISIATLLFYIGSFFSLDGFMYFEYFIAISLVILFSIFFLIFEATELKHLEDYSSRMFNLFAAGLLILLFSGTLIYFILGVTKVF